MPRGLRSHVVWPYMPSILNKVAVEPADAYSLLIEKSQSSSMPKPNDLVPSDGEQMVTAIAGAQVRG